MKIDRLTDPCLPDLRIKSPCFSLLISFGLKHPIGKIHSDEVSLAAKLVKINEQLLTIREYYSHIALIMLGENMF